MPSSNKTGHLRLNSWLGSDKPKKDDFNSDNRLVDDACKRMEGRIDALEGGKAAADTHMANTAAHVSAGDRGGWSNHMADLVAHVTQQDRARWGAGGGAGGMVVGTYTGNGEGSREIALGCTAKFGVLFAMGTGIADPDFVNEESRMFAGFFSSKGCSKNILVRNNGITIVHTVTRPMDGLSYKYNQNGVTYVYAVWPED